MREAKERFTEGNDDSLRLGGYGGTVHVVALEGGIVLKATQPTRRQKTIGPDTLGVRKAAVEAAEKILEGVRRQRTPTLEPRKPTKGSNGQYILTPRDIWEARLKKVLGQVPNGVLGWGRRRLVRHYEALTPRIRASIKSVDTVYGILVAARSLHEDGVLTWDKDISNIVPGDFTTYMMDAVHDGYSAHTVRSYVSRFRTAVLDYQRQWPDRWGEDRSDPTNGIEYPSTLRIQPPEIGEQRARLVIRQLRHDGEWRALAAAMFVLGSGRRIGAVGARRDGQQLDDVPLCENDFKVNEDGQTEVTWRGDPSKGGGYGRGDEVQVASHAVKVAYRWLRRFHPNPEGPEHPLIWDPDNPRFGAGYDGLRSAFKEAWERATGSQKPSGLLWHSFLYTTVTTIADELGVQAAAEYTGRSPEIVAKKYKRQRRARSAQVAERLNEVRT